MGYFITYLTYGTNKRNISIKVSLSEDEAKKEVLKLRACGHTHVEIRTDLFDEYTKMYKEIA